jgi:hypothetical protein
VCQQHVSQVLAQQVVGVSCLSDHSVSHHQYLVAVDHSQDAVGNHDYSAGGKGLVDSSLHSGVRVEINMGSGFILHTKNINQPSKIKLNQTELS